MSLNILDQLLINGAECNFVILKMTMIGFWIVKAIYIADWAEASLCAPS